MFGSTRSPLVSLPLLLLLSTVLLYHAIAAASPPPGNFPLRVVMDNNYPPYAFPSGFNAILPADYRRIEQRWLGIPADYGRYLRYAGILAVAAVVLILLLAAWNILLRRQVRRKTAQLREEVSLSNNRAEALRKSEEKHRTMVETIYDVIFEVDSRGVLTYVSPVVKDLLGYDPSEVIGKSFLEFIHGEDRDFVRDRLSMLVQGHRTPLDSRIYDKSGAVRWVRTITRTVLDARGEPAGARGMRILLQQSDREIRRTRGRQGNAHRHHGTETGQGPA